MTNIAYTENGIELGDVEVELPDQPKKHFELDDIVVVLIDTLGKSNEVNNVWGIKHDGSVAWKVEAAESPSGNSHPYTGLTVTENDIWAYNWNGHSYKIDPGTGNIVDKKYVK